MFAITISGSDVYVGGLFTDAGGNANADRIARWDGSQWHPLGSGLNDAVHDIALNGSDVYVGGRFTDAGGNANADRIARWDGSQWHPLGSGLNDRAYDIAVSGSDVYVGGSFVNAGGNDDADYIARWDGSAWHSVSTASGVAPFVYALATSASDVWVGGLFFGSSTHITHGPLNALPVELTTFTATRNGADVHLAWATATETNNAGFQLQHLPPASADWRDDAFLPGAGTTLTAQRYTHTVTELSPGTHRFRLKQIDYDGTFAYSPVVETTIDLDAAFELGTPYPNPFRHEAHFTLALQQPQHVRIIAYDALGRAVAELHNGPLEGSTTHTFTLDGTPWSSGRYLLRVVGERFSTVRPLTLVR
ncbi:MAG: hypothetical protein AAGJ10_06325 [Bacteroidota bacterium]